MDLTGEQLGDYRVLRRLGRGAMAEVYLAEQTSLARQIALKVLDPELAKDASYVNRFQHEARAAAALLHPNIVQIYEVGRTGGYHYIAQEYVPGRNVGELIERHGRLEPGLTLDVLRQVTSALHRASERGIVHRDIKPENVMLARSSEVKVADFGLARVEQPDGVKLTQVGVTMGTPLYMSPEQIEGKPVDARSDLYSLGVTAYHMLAGEPPFQGDTPLAVAVQHLNAEPTPLAVARPDVSPSFCLVVERLMAKEAAKRPESPAALSADLRVLAEQATVDGWAPNSGHWSGAESLVGEGANTQATAELGRLMQTAGAIHREPSRWKRGVLLVAVTLLAGGWMAATFRPGSVLTTAEKGPVEKSDVVRQIFHAKMVETSEEAWAAVAKRFPDADPYYHHLADQSLVGLYLRRQQYDDALRLCRRLSELGDSFSNFRLFGLAGIVVCETTRGEQAAAETALAQFPLEELPTLQEFSPQMASMFVTAKQRLNGSD
ncbi:MAG: serine/threonine-protein kinase [Planctomycetota bacterium]